jgi:hypothetical protein
MFSARQGVLTAVKGIGKVLGFLTTGWAVATLLGGCSTVFPAPMESHVASRQPLMRREMGGLPTADREPGRAVIWVVSNSYHTGLVLPLAWLEECGFRAPASVRGAKWINVSWGDRIAYLQERWLTPWEAARALFSRSDSVVEMIRVDYDPRWVFPNQEIYQASVDAGCGALLAAFLNHCAAPASGGDDWAVIAGPTWGRGALLASPHSYGFPRLCNSWTAGALEACGYSFDPVARIFAGALVARCRRQGFKRVPPLSPAEREFLAAYLHKIGHVED